MVEPGDRGMVTPRTGRRGGPARLPKFVTNPLAVGGDRVMVHPAKNCFTGKYAVVTGQGAGPCTVFYPPGKVPQAITAAATTPWPELDLHNIMVVATYSDVEKSRAWGDNVGNTGGTLCLPRFEIAYENNEPRLTYEDGGGNTYDSFFEFTNHHDGTETITASAIGSAFWTHWIYYKGVLLGKLIPYPPNPIPPFTVRFSIATGAIIETNLPQPINPPEELPNATCSIPSWYVYGDGVEWFARVDASANGAASFTGFSMGAEFTEAVTARGIAGTIHFSTTYVTNLPVIDLTLTIKINGAVVWTTTAANLNFADGYYWVAYDLPLAAPVTNPTLRFEASFPNSFTVTGSSYIDTYLDPGYWRV